MASINVLLMLISLSFSCVSTEETIRLAPALYIFGDSTVDGGNTDRFPPYGIDLYATVPIRWTNGMTIADFMATFLGLPLVPPYKNVLAAGISTTTGVNYAYAGCGILPQTCVQGEGSFDGQIIKFNSTLTNNLSRISTRQGILQHLSDSIFLLSFGINDFNRNYLPPNNGTLSYLEPEIFARFLLNEFSGRIKTLYELGARKFVVNNIWPLGCIPNPLANGCNVTINDLIRPYSNGLPLLLKDLQSKLSGVVFSCANNFQFVEDLKENPTKYGITNTTGMCFSAHDVCQDRDKYLYFDYLHSTQAANRVWSLNCFNATLCSPVNIMGLLGAK